MLKMVIADDETIVRNGILNILDWRDFGIEIIGAASDGQEAFDLCMELRPDILFTDIKMPFMDGIEVAEKLKEEGNDLKVIIFSGIQDFEYAKSAVNLNAEGYILKPMQVEELIKVINKVINKIKKEKGMEEKVRKLRQQLHENLGAAREKFLKNLTLSLYQRYDEIIEKLNYFKYPVCVDKPLIVAIIQTDDYEKVTVNFSEEDKQLLSFSIITIAEEIINNHTKGACFEMHENEFVMLLNDPQLLDRSEIDIYKEISENLSKYLGITISIGIGRQYTDILKLNSSYNEAKNALYFKFYTGKGAIINISDVSMNFEENDILDLYEEENNLINLIKSGNVEQTKLAIINLFDKLSMDKKYSMEYIQRICDEIVYATIRTLYELAGDFGEVIPNRSEILNSIYKTESIFDLQGKITNLLVEIAECFSNKYKQKNQKIVEDIKYIINKKYMEDLNINKIAGTVYLSPNYISVIFKQMTGETIIDFLTKTRMENAKILLAETNFRVLEISEMVGFKDASYFSKVFKKYTGLHPQKFRIIAGSSVTD